MLKLCDDNTIAVDTIAGGAVREPYDVRLDALWHHGSVKAALPRQYRIPLIAEASRAVVQGERVTLMDMTPIRAVAELSPIASTSGITIIWMDDATVSIQADSGRSGHPTQNDNVSKNLDREEYPKVVGPYESPSPQFLDNDR